MNLIRFPVQLVELGIENNTKGNTNSVKLLRLSRLPRLYRLLRILRLFKMFRLFKTNKSLKRLFDAIKMNAGIMKMFTVTITVFFLVHLVGCLWFL